MIEWYYKIGSLSTLLFGGRAAREKNNSEKIRRKEMPPRPAPVPAAPAPTPAGPAAPQRRPPPPRKRRRGRIPSRGRKKRSPPTLHRWLYRRWLCHRLW